MRNFKFRAWDEQKKVMHYDFEFIRSGTEGNDWIVFKSDKQKLDDKTAIFHPLENPYFQQQLKIMQFTGLKDKNGREIYEGDIVSGIKSEQNGRNPYEIKDILRFYYGGFELFSKPLQKFTWVNNQELRDIHWVDTGHLSIPDIYWKIVDIEIIGNIYENPELLAPKE